jgi:DNA polymerase III subunit gamma/tau
LKIESLPSKYRPKKFSDLIGQSHIVSQLEGMFKSQRMPSALLLTGLPGTGKTTLARMIASYLNCKSLVKSDSGRLEPCGECGNCKTDNVLNYTEINAADSRGIDAMRDLVAGSRNQTLTGGTRIYCIDEAHQLTPQASQLLLKPLEDTKKNTLWIIGSMSHEKLLPAIVSRCLRLDLKQVDIDTMVKFLARICKREKIEDLPGGEATLKLIGELSNCQPRAALSALDSVLMAVKSGSKLDSKTLLAQVLKNTEADVEKAAVNLVLYTLSQDVPGIVKTVKTSGGSRSLLHKAKWILSNLVDNQVGCANFKGYGTRLLEQKSAKDGIKLGLKSLITVQMCLATAEQQMNLGIDEDLAIISSLVK